MSDRVELKDLPEGWTGVRGEQLLCSIQQGVYCLRLPPGSDVEDPTQALEHITPDMDMRGYTRTKYHIRFACDGSKAVEVWVWGERREISFEQMRAINSDPTMCLRDVIVEADGKRVCIALTSFEPRGNVRFIPENGRVFTVNAWYHT